MQGVFCHPPQGMGKPALRLINGPNARRHVSLEHSLSSTATGVSGVSGERSVTSDANLCAEAACGDKQAFEALYRRHVAFAYDLAVRLQGSEIDAEDIVHDAFLKAHAGLADLRQGDRFRAWLGSVVVSCVRGRLRRKRLLHRLGIGGSAAGETHEVSCDQASPEVNAQLAQVRRLLEQVPADAQIAWTLRKVQRHSLGEVAELVGCSLATVKRRIAQAQAIVDAKFVDVPGAAGPGAPSTPSEVGGSGLAHGAGTCVAEGPSDD